MSKPNCQCAMCGGLIYRSPRQIAESKTGLFYCCQKHRKVGRTYKKTSYRKLAFDNLLHVCDDCGYHKLIDILEVHHVNLDHSDNRLDNLRILCPTCHRELHYMEKIEADLDADYDPVWDDPDWED